MISITVVSLYKFFTMNTTHAVRWGALVENLRGE